MLMIDSEEAIVIGETSQILFEISFLFDKFISESLKNPNVNLSYKDHLKLASLMQKRIKKLREKSPENYKNLFEDPTEFINNCVEDFNKKQNEKDN